MAWGIWQIFIRTLESVILLSKVENAWATTYRGVISNDTEDDEKAEEKLTCRFKIDIKNLTNFDSRTWKSQKCSL